MKSLTKPLLALLLAITVAGSVACGGETGTAKDGGQTPPQQSAAPRDAPMEQMEAAAPETFCTHLSAEDIDAALGGKLELGAPEGTESDCKIPILFGIDGNALVFRQLARGNYDAFKAYEAQSSTPFEYLEGLGREAFVLNNSRVCVLLSEDDALLISAQIVAIAEPLPISSEDLKAGLIELSTELVAQF